MNVFTLFGSIALDSTGVTRGLKEAETQAGRAGAAIERDLGARLDRLQQRLNSVGAGMSLLSAPLVAFGVTAIRTAGDFESAMNRVQGLTRATGDSFERLENLAKELGATTAFSASQAADAMGNLATAGFTVEEIYDALPGVLELAAASGLDLGEASDIAAKALRGFGLEAGEVTRVNDVMARVSSLSNQNVRQLGEAFTYVAPIANGLGFEFEETSAAIGLISDAGIQASSAGTGLRAVLTQLITEADDLGITTRDAAGNVLPLADILAQLEERGYTAEEAMLQFGETGGPALTALLARGTDALRNLNTELETSAGTAADLAGTRMQGFNGAIANLSSAFEALQIAVADSGLIKFVEDVVRSLTGFITAASELDPAILRIAVVIGAVVAAIGPALLAAGKLVEAFMAARLIIQGVTTAITVLRTAILAMAGPAGWIILAVTAIAAFTGAIVSANNLVQDYGENVEVANLRTRNHTRQLDDAANAHKHLQDRVERTVGGLRDAAESIRGSTGSLTELRTAVDRAASLMDGEGRQAFLQYAESAIAAGGDIDDIAAKISGQAERSSLINLVTELASGMQGEGRQAFIDYGLQAIATGETTQSAFDAIVRGWSAIQNAARIAELEVTANAQRAAVATAQAALNAIDPFTGGRDALAAARRALASARAALDTTNDAINQLSGSNLQFNRIVVEETVPAVRQLENATRSSTTATREATAASVEQRNEAAEALAAAAAAAAAADQAIAEINRANFEATAGIAASVDAAIEYTNAQSAALQAQADAAIAYVAATLTALDALISSVQVFTIDYEAITRNIADALTDTTAISNNLTRQAELLASEINADLASTAAFVNAAVAESNRLAEEIITSTMEALAEGNEEVMRSAEETVTALQSEATAILAFMQGVFDSTNALADEIDADTERIRQGIEDASDAAANATFPDYGRFAQSLKDVAEETADLTLRKLALGQATREEAIAALDLYIPYLQAEFEFVQADTLAYVELAEELARVLALKEAIMGGGNGAGGITGAGGIAAAITEGIQASLDAFASTIDGFVGNLVAFSAVAAGLIDTIGSNVPVIGDALQSFTLKFNEGTGALEASFSPLTLFTNILSAVINSSEAVASMFDEVLAALQPFIETIGTAIVDALKPFLMTAVQLVTALAPLIQIVLALVNTALQPLVWVLQTIVVPVFTFVANIITAIWNGIATALNRVLGIFGVNIPLIQRPDAGGAPGGGTGGGGGDAGDGRPGPDDAPAGTMGSSNGVFVVQDENGINVVYGANAPRARTIARERATIAALNQALSVATTPTQRATIRQLIAVHQGRLDALLQEGEAPAGPGGEIAPPGRIEQLRQERAAAVRRRDAAQSDEEIQAANDEIRAIDAEIRRLEALGAPVTPEEPPAPGTLNQLQRDRAAAVKRLNEATTEDEIRAANAEIREIDAEIARLRGLGAATTDTGGAPRQRRPRGGDSIFIPAPTPTAPVTPPPAPAPERPVTFDETALSFATVSQSVQFAVATPLVEASMMMLQAARTLVGAGDPASGLFAPIPPFTAVLERLTPILDRLIVEGVDVNVGTTSGSTRGIGLSNALRPL